MSFSIAGRAAQQGWFQWGLRYFRREAPGRDAGEGEAREGAGGGDSSPMVDGEEAAEAAILLTMEQEAYLQSALSPHVMAPDDASPGPAGAPARDTSPVSPRDARDTSLLSEPASAQTSPPLPGQRAAKRARTRKGAPPRERGTGRFLLGLPAEQVHALAAQWFGRPRKAPEALAHVALALEEVAVTLAVLIPDGDEAAPAAIVGDQEIVTIALRGTFPPPASAAPHTAAPSCSLTSKGGRHCGGLPRALRRDYRRRSRRGGGPRPCPAPRTPRCPLLRPEPTARRRGGGRGGRFWRRTR
jgi:hypothetical protein